MLKLERSAKLKIADTVRVMRGLVMLKLERLAKLKIAYTVRVMRGSQVESLSV